MQEKRKWYVEGVNQKEQNSLFSLIKCDEMIQKHHDRSNARLTFSPYPGYMLEECLQ